MSDEGFHLLTGGIAERLDAAEIRGVGLDQIGIKLVLANELTQSIADCTTATVTIGGSRGNFFASEAD